MRLRGFLTGYLALIAFSAVVTKGGSDRFAALTDDATGFVGRVLSADIPAIPDYAHGGGGGPTAQQAVAPKAFQLKRPGFQKPLP